MKTVVSDKILRDAVVAELEHDPELVATHISVVVVDGAVALGGHVMTIHEKHLAVRAAERVDAVRAVADDIEVREPSLHDRADDEIAEEIAHLRSTGTQIADSVAVQVRDARVILHGHVESEAQRDAAESAVEQLAGVRAVANLVTVDPPAEATTADLERRVQEAIAQLADSQSHSIRATVDEGTVHLAGQVRSTALLQTIQQAAETLPGVTSVENAIAVEDATNRGDVT